MPYISELARVVANYRLTGMDSYLSGMNFPYLPDLKVTQFSIMASVDEDDRYKNRFGLGIPGRMESIAKKVSFTVVSFYMIFSEMAQHFYHRTIFALT